MSKKNIGLFFLCFLMLFACFKLNPFRVYNTERTFEQIFANKPEDWSKDSESYVIGSLIESEKFGFLSGVGRLSRVHATDGENWFYNVQMTYKVFEENNFALAENFEMYYSQLGGQGFLFRFINKLLQGFNGFTRLKIMRNINVILLSLVLSIIALFIKNKTNIIAGIFFVIGILINQWLPITVTNLYWISWSWFLPMAISCIYCSVKNKSIRLKNILYLLLFASVVFKASSGYEFISTVLVAMMIPFILYELENYKSIIVFIKNLLMPAIIGIFGFIFTFVLHICRYMIGGWNLQDSIDFIKVIIIKRTNGSLLPLGINVEAWEKALSEPYLKLFKRYAEASSLNLEINGSIFEIRFWMIIAVIVLFCILLSILIYTNKINNKKQAVNLIIITLISFLAPLSWIVLARGHAASHILLVPVLFYVPFIPLGFSLIGYTFSNLRR